MANIETLFAKMTAPGQPRVSYGVYWAVNKMKNCGTKSSIYNGRHTFVQWVSYKDAEFIIPKLIGFDRFNGYREAIVYIGGDRVGVRYGTSGINGNIRVDVSWFDIAEMEKIAADEKAIEDAKKAIEEKKLEVSRYMIKYIVSFDGKCTREQYDAEMLRAFGKEVYDLFEN